MGIHKKLQKKYNNLRRKLCQTSLGNATIPIPPPTGFAIELTSRCNLACSMCPLHSKKSKALPDRRAVGDIDFELFKKIAEEVASFSPKPKLLLNYGGESLLYPRFQDVLTLLSELGLSRKCKFSTNANLLNREVSDMLLESFEGKFNVSLDGFKDSHERIRLGSNYDRVHDNLMYLLERRKSLGVSRLGISVNLTRVDQSESEIQEFVDYWVPLVDKVAVMLQLTPDSQIVQSNKYINDVLATKRKLCTEPFSYMGILWDGTVVLCCHDVLGLGANIQASVKNETILSIWRGAEFKKIRQKMITGDVSDIPACRNCEAWSAQHITKEITADKKYTVTQGGAGIKFKPVVAPANCQK